MNRRTFLQIASAAPIAALAAWRPPAAPEILGVDQTVGPDICVVTFVAWVPGGLYRHMGLPILMRRPRAWRIEFRDAPRRVVAQYAWDALGPWVDAGEFFLDSGDVERGVHVSLHEEAPHRLPLAHSIFSLRGEGIGRALPARPIVPTAPATFA